MNVMVLLLMRGNMREIEVNINAVTRIHSLWGGGSAKQTVGASGSPLAGQTRYRSPPYVLEKKQKSHLGSLLRNQQTLLILLPCRPQRWSINAEVAVLTCPHTPLATLLPACLFFSFSSFAIVMRNIYL